MWSGSRAMIGWFAAAAWLAAPAAAPAQGVFPEKRPIEFVVLFPAGTSADVTARVLAEGMSRQLGTQIVVVNRPGGGGAVGYRYAAAQAPDGHHLVWNSNSISTTYHTGMLPFDYKSFVPIARVQNETVLLFVRGDARWKRSEEHTSELQSQSNLVCRLLLEKKKKHENMINLIATFINSST